MYLQKPQARFLTCGNELLFDVEFLQDVALGIILPRPIFCVVKQLYVKLTRKKYFCYTEGSFLVKWDESNLKEGGVTFLMLLLCTLCILEWKLERVRSALIVRMIDAALCLKLQATSFTSSPLLQRTILPLIKSNQAIVFLAIWCSRFLPLQALNFCTLL